VANKMYPGYFNIQPEVFVRITNLPVLDPIRDLRQKDLGQLIRVMGVITKRSTVYSQLKTVIYVCIKCGEKKGPFHLENNDQAHTGICANCQSQGPFRLSQEELIYRNF
jgi:DNA replication licensing factor MCM2